MNFNAANFRRRIQVARKIAANVVLPTCVSMFVAEHILHANYPPAPWQSWTPIPWHAKLILEWRNYSMLLVLTCAFFALPRWQSLLGLFILFGFIFYLSGQ